MALSTLASAPHTFSERSVNRMKNTKLYRTNNGLHYMPRVQVVFDKPTCLDHGLCVHGSVTFKASVCGLWGPRHLWWGGGGMQGGGGRRAAPTMHAWTVERCSATKVLAMHVSRTNEHK